MKISHFGAMALLLLAGRTAYAIAPPANRGALPPAYYDRVNSNPSAFQFSKALFNLTSNAELGREKIRLGAAPVGIIKAVQGHKRILIILAQFSDTVSSLYARGVLLNKLFGRTSSGKFGAATLSAYYEENSYGKLIVDGDVLPWVRLTHPQAYYAGAPYQSPDGSMNSCDGLCRQNSKVADLVQEAVKSNDSASLWGRYDNDGPDDKANSPDDDGQVDFVVIVHPGKGAECQDGTPNAIWSHQDRLSNWAGHTPYVTKAVSNSRTGIGNIQVDDYVIVPAVSCDGVTPVPIGIIAHEFGHSLRLPDLYDTSQYPQSEGIGNWDLMAGGAWGGDGRSPDMPVHMSAWSKAYLGWVTASDQLSDKQNVSISAYEEPNPTVLLLPVSGSVSAGNNIYYLVTNRQPVGFDSKIPGKGLLVLRVDEGVLKDSLRNNNVNVNPSSFGVAVVEADGAQGLIHHGTDINRGGTGDTFPGSSDKRLFDRSTTPANTGGAILCGIGNPASVMTVDVITSRNTCTGVALSAGGERLSIQQLVRSSEHLAGRSVRVTGVLSNTGPNYFGAPLRLVLRDASGNSIAVLPWTPVEVARGLHGTGPPSLAQYLGHEVEIIGILQHSEVGNTVVLSVDDVNILR